MANPRHLFERLKGAYHFVHRVLHPSRKAILVSSIIALMLVVPSVAQAGFGEWVVLLIGNVIEFFVQLFGKLLVGLIDILVQVAQYNDFGTSQAINVGWAVVRDLANMLFIVTLIVISFGTVLQWEAYKYNRLLGNLVLTAVLVNFSRGITLFLVDFSQVIMMTFVNAFRDVAAGNLTTGFGIQLLLAYADSSTSVDINLRETVMIYALAIILILVALIVTLTLIVILIRRIISLWIIIILAPLAFIASVMPGGVGNFNKQWWSRLGKEMFTGPALAFFLWLSFTVISLSSSGGTTANVIPLNQNGDPIVQSNEEQVQLVVSEIGSTKNLFNFIVTVALLIHSMTIAKEAGGFAGAFAGKMSGYIDRGGAAMLRTVAKTPGWISKKTGVTGIAQRAGYTAADKTLGVLSKLPVVGNKFAVPQGRLAKFRSRQEEEMKKELSMVNKDNLLRMTNGPAIGEKARARKKAAIEMMIDSGDSDDLTKQARIDYRRYIGYQEKAVKNVDPNTGQESWSLKRSARDQNGYTRLKNMTRQHMEFWLDDVENKSPEVQNAVRAKLDTEIKKMKRPNWTTTLDVDAVKANTSNPEMRKLLWEGWRSQNTWDQSKWPLWFKEMPQTIRDFLNASHPDQPAKIGTLNNPEYDANRISRFDDMVRDRRVIGMSAFDRPTLTTAGNTDAAGVNPYEMLRYAKGLAKGTVFTGPKTKDQIDVDNLMATRGVTAAQAAKEIEDYTKKHPMTSEKYGIEEEWMRHESKRAPSKSPLADVAEEDRKRFEKEQQLRSQYGLTGSVTPDQMREAAKASKEGGIQGLPKEVQDAFNNQITQNKTADQIIAGLDEFDDQKSYTSEDAYQESRRIFEVLSKEQGPAPEFVAGRDPLARLEAEQRRAQETGRASYARFAADFSKMSLDTDLAGVNVSGTEKDALIPKLQEMYEKQLELGGGLSAEQIQEKVTSFGQAIQKSEYLAIANTARKGYTLGHVMRHEGAHSEIDNLVSEQSGALEEMFSSLSEEKQNQIIGAISKQWKFDKLPDPEKRKRAIEEYFTEGLANFGRSDAVGPQLEEGLALALKDKGVRMKGYQSSVLQGKSDEAAPSKSTEALETNMRGQEIAVQDKLNELEGKFEEMRESANLSPEVTVQMIQDPLAKKELQEKGFGRQLSDLQSMQRELQDERRHLSEVTQELRLQREQNAKDQERFFKEQREAAQAQLQVEKQNTKPEQKPSEAPQEKRQTTSAPKPPQPEKPKPPENVEDISID